MSVSDKTRLKVWVRSGGRCAICNRYLLDDNLIGKEVTIGELAHIVAQSTGAKAPRGDEPLDLAERDDPENLVLVCPNEHDAFDRPELTGVVTRDVLLDVKSSHEDRIKHLTGLGQNRQTAVIRLTGNVRGSAVEISRDDVATAVLNGATRFPHYPMTPGREGVEIDLRHIPGEETATADYYSTVSKQIDEVLDRQFYPSVVHGTVGHHISLFGFARIPALLYFGYRLDDNLDADVYDKHRDSGWSWPGAEPCVTFAARVADEDASHHDINIVLNISGTIGAEEIPQELTGRRTYIIEPVGAVPKPGLLTSSQELLAFRSELASVLGGAEEYLASIGARQTGQINLFAAVPCSVAITIGRLIARGSHPAVVVWERRPSDRQFQLVMTLNARSIAPPAIDHEGAQG